MVLSTPNYPTSNASNDLAYGFLLSFLDQHLWLAREH